MEIYKGGPESMEGRLDREKRVYELLDELDIEYYRTDHPDARAYTMEMCMEIDAALETKLCKNLFLCNRQQTEFYLLLMPGEKPFKTKEITKQIGSARLSFAKPEHMLEYLDIEPGAVSLMGLMNDSENRVKLLVDEEILDEEWLGCHPCVNTSSMKLRTKDAFGKFLEAVHHDYMKVTLKGSD